MQLMFRCAFVFLACWPGIALSQQSSTGIVDKLATTNPPAIIKGKAGRQETIFNSDFDLAESKRIDAAAKEALHGGADDNLCLALFSSQTTVRMFVNENMHYADWHTVAIDRDSMGKLLGQLRESREGFAWSSIQCSRQATRLWP